jgi:tRNA(adenine34) deaminase
MNPDDQTDYMLQALAEARAAGARGEIPVGALIVDGTTGEVIARAGNTTEADNNPCAHAEMAVLQHACALKGAPRLPDCDLYVTLEPCSMCATAISFARIRRVYFGAYDPKGGGIDHGPKIFSHPTCHHRPEVYGGIHEQACGDILKDFFKDRRF